MEVTFTTEIAGIAENIKSLLDTSILKYLGSSVVITKNTNIYTVKVKSTRKHFPELCGYIIGVIEDFDALPPPEFIKGYNQAKKKLRDQG